MSEFAIRAENLSKRYRIGTRKPRPATLAQAVGGLVRAPLDNYRRLRAMRHFDENGHDAPDVIWALRDVAFDVRHGEVVGIIGRNGAGKSTLLKILSRITEPSSGRAVLEGRVASLLEVGTGFHPDLTGRENVYLNGTLLGMTRAEVDRKFDEIVAFAGVEEFMETPVRFYSSGMRVRLAFAVAAHLEAEILLIDEVLAVGDVEFQKKCLGKMESVASTGRTVLFVSHNMVAVENHCPRSLLIESGRIGADDTTDEVVKQYLSALDWQLAKEMGLAERKDRSGNGAIRLTSFHVEGPDGERLKYIRTGMDVTFAFGYVAVPGVQPEAVDVGFSLHQHGQMLCVLYSSYTGAEFRNIGDQGFFRCRVERFPFNAGYFTVGARVEVDGEEADWPSHSIADLEVQPGDFYATGHIGFPNTPLVLDGEWDVVATAVA
jgi:lipopolysaccharide transport system ATP-binding protein